MLSHTIPVRRERLPLYLRAPRSQSRINRLVLPALISPSSRAAVRTGTHSFARVRAAALNQLLALTTKRAANPRDLFLRAEDVCSLRMIQSRTYVRSLARAPLAAA